MDCEYLVERRLKSLSPRYHELLSNTAFSVVFILEKYKNFFPNYTDHTIAHSLNVLDFVNHIIGEEIDKLNADELYILIMGAYLHDTGMGTSVRDFEKIKDNVVPPQYFIDHPNEPIEDTIRSFHHELSGEFVKRYYELFEIPSDKHVFAIAEVSRGHRVADLYDEQQFPVEYKLDNGNTVCLPYLAALIRLADEIDLAADRIFTFDYPESNTIYKKMIRCIKKMDVTDDAFIYTVCTDDEELYPQIEAFINKAGKTLDQCKKVVEERTHFRIKQNKVVINRVNENAN